MERQQWTAQRATAHLADLLPNESIVVPSIAAAELVNGMYRAKTEEQFRRRSDFVRSILQYYPIASFDEQEAWAAGRVRGEQAALGNSLPLGDSFIAATALTLNFSVLTANVKDFIRIPGLRVVQFSLP